MKTSLSDFLEMSPEKKSSRKKEWKLSKELAKQNIDYEAQKAEERALKALILIKKHLYKEIVLDDAERIALCGIII